MLDNSICLKKFLYVHGIYSCSVTIPLQTILIQLTRPQHPLAFSPPKSIPLVTLILSPKSRKWPTSSGIHNLFVKIDSSLPRHALFHFPFPVPSSLPSLYPSKFYFFLPNPLEPPPHVHFISRGYRTNATQIPAVENYPAVNTKFSTLMSTRKRYSYFFFICFIQHFLSKKIEGNIFLLFC
jgi:hypothetical protein